VAAVLKRAGKNQSLEVSLLFVLDLLGRVVLPDGER
jgi:hypothetical protein